MFISIDLSVMESDILRLVNGESKTNMIVHFLFKCNRSLDLIGFK